MPLLGHFEFLFGGDVEAHIVRPETRYSQFGTRRKHALWIIWAKEITRALIYGFLKNKEMNNLKWAYCIIVFFQVSEFVQRWSSALSQATDQER